MLVFGPVPSRRLGNSLGINHIFSKHCSYACVYCQVGRTNQLEIRPRAFYTVKKIISQVQRKISESMDSGRRIDYLTLVPDGEPALDFHLEDLILALKRFSIPIGVISNSSLIDQPSVQSALLHADWVSLKFDAVCENAWRKINRPHGSLVLQNILTGALLFRQAYPGKLVTETMLISQINDTADDINLLISYLLELQPFKSYLSIPTRPPCEKWVTPPPPERLRSILEACSDRLNNMDLLFDAEVGDFISTGDLTEDILSIAAVHPVREESLKNMVSQAGKDWSLIHTLVQQKALLAIRYRSEVFYFTNPEIHNRR